VQTTASALVYCNGTSAWSATLAPQQGRFDNGFSVK
jgi:hypothetical protein